MKKFKGSGLLIMTVVSAAIIGLTAVSLVKLNHISFNSVSSNNIAIQAQQYAEARAKIVKTTSYYDLKSLPKTIISESNGFFEEVVLGEEITLPEDSNMMKRNMIVKIYKDNETLPRASIVVPRYSSSDFNGVYVVNNAFNDEESKKLFLDVNKNNRFIVADDKGNSQKLLSNIAETYKGDLNNLRETGIFSGSNLGNAPDSGAYSIENIRQSDVSGVYVNQRVTKFNENKTYTRQCRNGNWSTWSELGGGSVNFTITTGSVCDGEYIPIPKGFTRSQCKYAIWPLKMIDSDRSYSTDSWHYCHVDQDTGLVSAYYRYSAGYIIRGQHCTVQYLCFASK